ncbi:C2H2 type zinc-finger domain-containing protein [Trichoderma evansii]
MEDKSPSLCRLCDVKFDSPSEWRQHAKSDWHVYNLRMKVAEPGAVISPPSASQSAKRTSSPKAERAADVEDGTKLNDESDVDVDGDIDSDVDVDGGTELSAQPEFNPGQCLFCGEKNENFGDNLEHMSKTHSFTIPQPAYLIVEPETLVGYLYLVIHGYGECILCAARRNTVEGIQHHMTAKGHCRFNVASDLAEFYDIPSLGYQAGEESLRLPSGRLLSHRTGPSRSALARIARQSAERHLEANTASELATQANESELVPTQNNDYLPTAAPSMQLSQLSRGDQESLAHLPDHEVRSLLATTARAIDQSRREEQHSQLGLGQAGNTTLTGHFRMDTSKRFRGPWG